MGAELCIRIWVPAKIGLLKTIVRLANQQVEGKFEADTSGNSLCPGVPEQTSQRCFSVITNRG